MIFRFLKKLKRNFGFLDRSDWVWNFDINYSDNTWKSLINYKFKIQSSQEGEIFFKTLEPVLGGWYFFGIKHKGNNNYCFGSLSSGKKGFPQARPMFPIRRRWRVIRIKKNQKVYLRLINVNSDLIIDELWLIPIFKFYALHKIRIRIHTTLGLSFSSINKLKSINLWRMYNKLLLSQKVKKRYFNYYYWQEEVEKDAILKILSLKEKINSYPKSFIIQENNNFSTVPDGDYVIFKNCDGLISEWAIDVFSVVLELNNNCLLLYPDEDCINTNKKRHNPNFKTAWNRELFFSNPLFSNCWVIDSKLWNKALKNLSESNYQINSCNLIIEIIKDLENNNNSSKIIHTPFVCFHKIKNQNRSEKSINSKSAFYLENYINEYFCSIKNKVKIGIKEEGYKINWLSPVRPFLSILIPTRDKVELLRKCISSIEEKSAGTRYEIIIIDNDSKDINTFDYFRSFIKKSNNQLPRKIIKIEGKFNYSLLNNSAAKVASGDVLLLLNNDVQFISHNWGFDLASNALRDGIGCVGAKLLFPDETIQHAGVILGIGGVAGHSHKYFSTEDYGFQKRINLQQEISAVTGACLAISRRNWEILGGLDSKNLKVNYNDIDLCLKSLNYGLKNIYTPNVIAYHFESKSRGKPIGEDYKKWKKEYNFMKKKWSSILFNDPFYSPHLSLMEEDFSIHLKKLNLISRSYNKFTLFDDFYL